MTEDTMGERRHVTLRELSMTAVLLLNFGGLVWGAATMSNSLRNLDGTTKNLNTSIKEMSIKLENIQINYGSRMAVVESKVEGNTEEIEKLKERVR